MTRSLIVAWSMLGALLLAPTAAAEPCDATGVWRITWTDASDGFAAPQVIEVSIDPRLMRVELVEPSLGVEEGLVTGFDAARCRLHVMHRATARYEEGYGNTDTTLRVAFTLGPGRRRVSGRRRVHTLDPEGVASYAVRGTARRRAGWSRGP